MKKYFIYIQMSLLILPEEIMTNIIENVSDYNLYI